MLEPEPKGGPGLTIEAEIKLLWWSLGYLAGLADANNRPSSREKTMSEIDLRELRRWGADHVLTAYERAILDAETQEAYWDEVNCQWVVAVGEGLDQHDATARPGTYRAVKVVDPPWVFKEQEFGSELQVRPALLEGETDE